MGEAARLEETNNIKVKGWGLEILDKVKEQVCHSEKDRKRLWFKSWITDLNLSRSKAFLEVGDVARGESAKIQWR